MTHTQGLLSSSAHRYTPQEIRRLTTKVVASFLLSAGILYHIAECALFDTMELIGKQKSLPRGLWLGWTKKAYRLSKAQSIDNFAKSHLKQGYSLWIDATDNALGELKPIVDMSKYSLGNIILKNTHDHATLKTQVLHTAHMYELCTAYYKEFFLAQAEKHWIDFEHGYHNVKQQDVYLALRASALELCPSVMQQDSVAHDMQLCENALLNTIAKKDFFTKIFQGITPTRPD